MFYQWMKPIFSDMIITFPKGHGMQSLPLLIYPLAHLHVLVFGIAFAGQSEQDMLVKS